MVFNVSPPLSALQSISVCLCRQLSLPMNDNSKKTNCIFGRKNSKMTKSMFVIPVKSYVDSENRYIETGLDRYMAKTTFFKSQASDWPPGCFMTDKNLTTLFIGSKKEKDTFSRTFLQRCNRANQFTPCKKQMQILWNICGLIFGAGSSDLIWRGWQKGLVIKL